MQQYEYKVMKLYNGVIKFAILSKCDDMMLRWLEENYYAIK